jgi:hypothetical protein
MAREHSTQRCSVELGSVWRLEEAMKKPRTLGVSFQIFVFLLLSLAGAGSHAQENSPVQENASADNPPSRVARISYLKGSVSFQPAGHDQWSEATLNFTVTTGDRIYADKGARAELQVGPYSVRLSDRTDLTITNLNDEIMQLGLEQGTLRVSVYQMPSGNTVEVDTPNGALTLLGPGAYRADVDPSGDATLVTLNSGSLEITGGGVSQTLQAGQAVKLTGHDSIQALSVPVPRLDSFDKWSEERDQRISSSASARYVSRNTPGFDDLDAYGRWEEVAEYGPVWYPAGIALEWVPYRFGRWVWVGPWGWTWVEDEPWGFCPFHYGRWVHIGVAWGWLPGPIVVTPVYAPALVAFVGGPHFSLSIAAGGVGLVAWFPLGPGEPYFPWYHCRTEYIREVNVTNIRNVTNITNINNIHYAYRTVATTAVHSNVFNSGQPVARQVVRLTPQQLARAQVIPHPSVNPTVRAALPGKPVSAPPVRAQSLATAGRALVGTRPTRGQEPRPAPLVTKNPAPAQHSVRPPMSTAVGTQPPSGTVLNSPLRASPPGLIIRSTPPPPRVPFVEQRRFMSEHPGRPLEPHQLENLRAGRAAGLMQDREFPPHMAPVPRARPAPPPVPSRQRKP